MIKPGGSKINVSVHSWTKNEEVRQSDLSWEERALIPNCSWITGEWSWHQACPTPSPHAQGLSWTKDTVFSEDLQVCSWGGWLQLLFRKSETRDPETDVEEEQQGQCRRRSEWGVGSYSRESLGWRKPPRRGRKMTDVGWVGPNVL